MKPGGKGWGSGRSEPAQGGSPGCGLRETRRGGGGGWPVCGKPTRG